ncbi:DUF1523 family protein [Pseudaeromonas paramecii]|uniref:DUF1523 family protein n=1 Tax=Pseudaeromonas paramecii TaxID=2138166 RepID=A0ABP8QEJ8_9GAMM
MKALLRKLALGLLAGLLVISGVWLDFYLPEKSITTITGVEVKRVDKDGPIGKENPADGPTTDVYYLYTVSAGEKVRVFRNEDTGWGFPFYFKFNSADVQARAKALEFEKGLARITSYGWRLNMFSWFPNVTKIERVESAEVSTFSFFRWLGFGLWLLAWGWIARLVWRSDWAWPDAEV